MDKNVGNLVNSTIFQLPTLYGKGVLITPTVHGNLLVGPTAEDVNDKEDIATTGKGLERVLEKSRISVPDLPQKQIITSFAGLRAHTEKHDFRIEEAEDAPGFIDAAGIESPGLSSAPAIGEYVADLVQKILPTEEKRDFKEKRKGIPNMAEMSYEDRKKLIGEDSAYGNVVCRCELVTEGEILEAIRRIPGMVTVDGIKRRTRAGMGRCQSGFCSPKVTEILARELGCDMGEITKSGEGAELLFGFNKEGIR